MAEVLAGLIAVVLGLVLVVVRRRRGVTAVVVAAEPDTALLSSAATLRRLGARITRYDNEAGTLEARLAPAGVVRVHATAAEEGTTRVRLEGDPAARSVMRRFRRALS
jgi:hypothetical protein